MWVSSVTPMQFGNLIQANLAVDHLWASPEAEEVWCQHAWKSPDVLE